MKENHFLLNTANEEFNFPQKILTFSEPTFHDFLLLHPTLLHLDQPTAQTSGERFAISDIQPI